jgi:hypothetical protein
VSLIELAAATKSGPFVATAGRRRTGRRTTDHAPADEDHTRRVEVRRLPLRSVSTNVETVGYARPDAIGSS